MEISNELKLASFDQNGVLIFDNVKEYYVFDLVTMQDYKISNDSKLNKSKIKDILVLDECGLILPDSYLITILGSEFI